MCSVTLHTGLDLSLLAFVHHKLVQFLLVFGAQVAQAVCGLGGHVELVHGDDVVWLVVDNVTDGGYVTRWYNGELSPADACSSKECRGPCVSHWSIADRGVLAVDNLENFSQPKSLNPTLTAACSSSATAVNLQQQHPVTRAKSPVDRYLAAPAAPLRYRQTPQPAPNMSQPIGNRQQAPTAPCVLTTSNT